MGRGRENSKIVRAAAELWRYPLPGVTGGSGITEVDVIVVDLETADGVTGTGFSYVLGGGGATVAATASNMIERFVANTEMTAPAALWRRLAASLNRLGRGTGYLAIAAIDVAAWDLHAKRQGVPLAMALGGEPRAVPVYGSGGFGPAQHPDDAAKRALEYAAMGCGAVKLRLAGNSADIARLRAVADILPDDVHLMADVNEKCDLVTARWLASECGEFNLLWLEEPLPATDIAGYADLSAASPVPIATGEHHQGLVELAPFFDRKCCSVIQPDLAMMGGITESLRVATIAEHYGLVVAPHFLPALFVHLAAACPSVRWMEHFPLLEPLFDSPVEMDRSGMIAPSTAPGHGLAWADGARADFRIGD
ncbi:MAG: mandelate racemase/muconate lactonizing enzyme family protein [Rhodospirillaceae bacterium]|jgi:L-alanine-DL-glutamate epimerase-like enolase superfamily enzyme|nr:mandelate racemase/muconate lactonizing enzyme family protein [Rhodospirillaceae bacterium]MBT5458624.1 mandelate racemase/muconate lactonizing enzyme family protein [Rhodospirillaceae bacterium]